MWLSNAHRPSWLVNAMEPVLNNGLRAFPISRAQADCDSMNTDTHRTLDFRGQARRGGLDSIGRQPFPFLQRALALSGK